jgi:hypothetical protein
MISRWSLAYSSATCRAWSVRDGLVVGRGFSSVMPDCLSEESLNHMNHL